MFAKCVSCVNKNSHVIDIPQEPVLAQHKKYFNTLEKYYTGRDYSHGWEHVTRVCANALFICKYENITNERDIKIIIVSALGHDIWDHKYVGKHLIEPIKQEFDNDMSNMGLLAADRDLIMRIIDNISFSKEFAMRQRGETFDLEVPEERLRDIVSDADKLEALGIICIERMIEYELHIQNTKVQNIQAHINHIKSHCQDKLYRLIEDKYIKTITGVELAQPLMAQMKNIVDNELRLEAFIKNYIGPPAI